MFFLAYARLYSFILCPELLADEGRETWGKKIEFLLAVIGFAVDLGNVWRLVLFVVIQESLKNLRFTTKILSTLGFHMYAMTTGEVLSWFLTSSCLSLVAFPFSTWSSVLDNTTGISHFHTADI